MPSKEMAENLVVAASHQSTLTICVIAVMKLFLELITNPTFDIVVSDAWLFALKQWFPKEQRHLSGRNRISTALVEISWTGMRKYDLGLRKCRDRVNPSAYQEPLLCVELCASVSQS